MVMNLCMHAYMYVCTCMLADMNKSLCMDGWI